LHGGKRLVHGHRIADIGANEREARLALQVRERGEIAGVGKLIDDRDLVSGDVRQPSEIRSDEAGTAGDEEFHWE
jgi:hypothetical protein